MKKLSPPSPFIDFFYPRCDAPGNSSAELEAKMKKLKALAIESRWVAHRHRRAGRSVWAFLQMMGKRIDGKGVVHASVGSIVFTSVLEASRVVQISIKFPYAFRKMRKILIDFSSKLWNFQIHTAIHDEVGNELIYRKMPKPVKHFRKTGENFSLWRMKVFVRRIVLQTLLLQLNRGNDAFG